MGNFAASSNRQISHMKLTAPDIPAPCLPPWANHKLSAYLPFCENNGSVPKAADCCSDKGLVSRGGGGGAGQFCLEPLPRGLPVTTGRCAGRREPGRSPSPADQYRYHVGLERRTPGCSSLAEPDQLGAVPSVPRGQTGSLWFRCQVHDSRAM